MDKVINFRKRAQRFEERARDCDWPPSPRTLAKSGWRLAPRRRSGWKITSAHLAVGAGTGEGRLAAIVPGHFPPKDTSLVTFSPVSPGRSLVLRACRNCRAAPELT